MSLLDGSADDLRATMEASPEEAVALLKTGAEAGLPEAQAAYGQALLDGRGVAPDTVAALGWFRRAAAGGDAMGMNMVGRCFEKGWGTAEDRAEATRWYARAAQAGLDWGMYNVGSALALGAGVEKDEAAALAWFQRAGAMGHAKSINFVGSFHEEGRVTARDRAKAAECYARGRGRRLSRPVQPRPPARRGRPARRGGHVDRARGGNGADRVRRADEGLVRSCTGAGTQGGGRTSRPMMERLTAASPARPAAPGAPTKSCRPC